MNIQIDNKDSKLALWLILAVGAAVRIVTALISENINHPDEIFQVLEQAHRVVFGYGIIPWEYRLAARTWLVPGIMTIFLYPFKILGLDNPHIYIPGIKIIMSLISLSIVVSSYYIGKKLVSHRAGLWAAFFSAVWYEIIYFSIRPMSEVWAATFFMAAMALALNGTSRRILITAGFLAVMSVAVRINYIPAVAVLIFMVGHKMDSTSKINLLIGLAAGIVFVGIFETITLGVPFISYIHYYHYNQTFFMTGPFGSIFSYQYVMFLGYASLFVYWLIIAAGFLYWKENKLLLFMVMVMLISHIILPAHVYQVHYRHIYVLIPILMIIAGIMTDKLISRLKNFIPLYPLVAILFLGLSATGAMAALPRQKEVYNEKILPVYNQNIFQKNGRLLAYLYLYDLDNVHSVYDNAGEWFYGGGYYYLHKNVPLYLKNTPPPSSKHVSHMLSQNLLVIASGIRFNKSFGEFHLHIRDDSNYIYPIDSAYNYYIPQPGIDDTLIIK
ncbi:MAG: hypothetical protein AB1746_02450 [Candidatus Zixiibacteriota bacterium]